MTEANDGRNADGELNSGHTLGTITGFTADLAAEHGRIPGPVATAINVSAAVAANATDGDVDAGDYAEIGLGAAGAAGGGALGKGLGVAATNAAAQTGSQAEDAPIVIHKLEKPAASEVLSSAWREGGTI